MQLQTTTKVKYKRNREKYKYKDLIKELLKTDITFCICISKNKFTDDLYGRTYEIICAEKDSGKLNGLFGFIRPDRDEEAPDNILVHQMDANEIASFKENRERFIISLQNKDGIIYDLKDYPFKAYYSNHNISN